MKNKTMVVALCRVFCVITELIPPIDFTYTNFNTTTGLQLNSATTVVTCEETNKGASLPLLFQKHPQYTTQIEKKTSQNDDREKLKNHLSSVGHRDIYASSESICIPRLRLTPPLPFQVGTIWHGVPHTILGGFNTTFSFKITDQSQECNIVRNTAFSTLSHESCVVHGGDGFAFVIHVDENRALSVGRNGEGLGYQGIKNSIAVEFDTWYNVQLDDPIFDHITVHSSGLLENDPGANSRLCAAKRVNLADGNIHTARIVYFPYVNENLVSFFTASPALTQFIRDIGEGKRIGSLAIYLDDMATPIMALPINMAAAIRTIAGKAYVGFTGSTGSFWQTHDILSWTFCESVDCRGRNNVPIENLDYLQHENLAI